VTSNVGDADSLKALDLNPPNREEKGPVRQVLSAWFVLTALAVATLVISIV
jgi:hypothetical protein